MKRKIIYSLLAVLVSAGAVTTLLAWDFGVGTTPMAKFFMVFFGAIIVLQCIPALLLFVCMIKGLARGSSSKPALAKNSNENSVPL